MLYKKTKIAKSRALVYRLANKLRVFEEVARKLHPCSSDARKEEMAMCILDYILTQIDFKDLEIYKNQREKGKI